MTKYHIDTKELSFLIQSTYEAELLILEKVIHVPKNTEIILRKFRCFLYWYHHAKVDFLMDLLPEHMIRPQDPSRPQKMIDVERFYPIKVDDYLWDNLVDKKNFINSTNRLRQSWIKRLQ